MQEDVHWIFEVTEGHTHSSGPGGIPTTAYVQTTAAVRRTLTQNRGSRHDATLLTK